jgi:hypothetical protein
VSSRTAWGERTRELVSSCFVDSLVSSAPICCRAGAAVTAAGLVRLQNPARKQRARLSRARQHQHGNSPVEETSPEAQDRPPHEPGRRAAAPARQPRGRNRRAEEKAPAGEPRAWQPHEPGCQERGSTSPVDENRQAEPARPPHVAPDWKTHEPGCRDGSTSPTTDGG